MPKVKLVICDGPDLFESARHYTDELITTSLEPESDTSWRRVSYIDIINMLCMGCAEHKLVTEIEKTTILEVIKNGYDVVIETVLTKAKLMDAYFQLFYNQPFEVEFDSQFYCNSPGTEERFNMVFKCYMKDYLQHRTSYLKYKETQGVDCYIFDIDGTLAVKETDRRFYDWKRVNEDVPNPPVVHMYEVLRTTSIPIFIVTGRDSICREETTQWLRDNDIDYQELFMRAHGDYRKDSFVKADIMEVITAKGYKPKIIFDDRDQVCETWRYLGLTCFQVARGDF